MQLTPGVRLRSAVCDTEIVVVRPPAAPGAVLACGGLPMLPHGAAPERAESVLDGYGGGTILGKRYGSDEGPLEVLVTKAGQGALSLDGHLLQVKQAKPLPSSD